MMEPVQKADAELFVDGTACQDIQALQDVIQEQLSYIRRPQNSEGMWLVSVDLSRQNWQPTEREEEKLAAMIEREPGLYWGQMLFSGAQREPAFLELEEQDVDWKERFTDGKTTLIRQSLRSGQNFYTRGNVVVLGDINPGAEIVAGGSILVMGALRGLAHAGRFGDERKIVAALKMQPIQLRIAEHITRPPDDEKGEGMFPEVARIRGGRVVIESMMV